MFPSRLFTRLRAFKHVENTLTRTRPAFFATSDQNVPQDKPISKAMRAYLKRAQEYDEFMRREQLEFEIGKRHLANIMGEDASNFSQADVDNAIEYLFPSGLYDKKARPVMKPPEELFPKRKAAEFDEAGRPYHYLFYTGKPNFYQLMHDIVNHLSELNRLEDSNLKKSIQPDPTKSIGLEGTVWLDQNELSRKLLETVDDREYGHFVLAMDRIAQHAYAYEKIQMVHEYRKPIMKRINRYEMPDVKYDDNGVAYVTTYECLRKRARGHVTIRCPGTGQIRINGKGLDYFADVQPREQVLFPLIFTGMLNKVDVDGHVEGGGSSGQAGAIRWGIAMGLRNFVDAQMLDSMQTAGLLQRDFRTKERKKYGQEGARRKFTWKKR